MANITKKDICEAIAKTTGLTQVDTQIIVETLLDAIKDTLQEETTLNFGDSDVSRSSLWRPGKQGMSEQGSRSKSRPD